MPRRKTKKKNLDRLVRYSPAPHSSSEWLDGLVSCERAGPAVCLPFVG
jgi:hypothetical protein